ncbi:MAG: hypothetical protein ACYDBB_21475 [Armatimonadota bacterium]
MSNTVMMTPEEELSGLSSVGIRDRLAELEQQEKERRAAGQYAEAATIAQHRQALDEVATLAIARAEVREAEQALSDLDTRDASLREQGKPLVKKCDALREAMERLKEEQEQADLACNLHFNQISTYQRDGLVNQCNAARLNLEATELGITPAELTAQRQVEAKAALTQQRNELRKAAQETYNREHAQWVKRNRKWSLENGPHPGPEPVLQHYTFSDE